MSSVCAGALEAVVVTLSQVGTLVNDKGRQSIRPAVVTFPAPPHEGAGSALAVPDRSRESGTVPYQARNKRPLLEGRSRRWMISDTTAAGKRTDGVVSRKNWIADHMLC